LLSVVSVEVAEIMMHLKDSDRYLRLLLELWPSAYLFVSAGRAGHILCRGSLPAVSRVGTGRYCLSGEQNGVNFWNVVILVWRSQIMGQVLMNGMECCVTWASDGFKL
jgi:hypothetical protein